MIRPLDQVDDTTLRGLDAAGCCTNCASHVLAGAGNQVVDGQGRLHRHCAKCHGELMAVEPSGVNFKFTPHPYAEARPLSTQLGGNGDPGPGAGRGPGLPKDSPDQIGLSPISGSEEDRLVAGPGGPIRGKERA